MSAPTDDLMGNAVHHPTLDSDSGEIEVSVVDDRPEEDQVAERDPERSGDFDPDEEINVVGRSATNRIKRLRYEYHEQRRAKDDAMRLQEEAVRYAQQVASENVNLKSMLKGTEKVFLSEIKARTAGDLSQARDHFKNAMEAGDSDAIVQAQEAFNRAQYDAGVAEGYQPEFPQGDPAPPQPNFTPSQPVDEKLQGWLSENEWFGSGEGKDSERTSFAYGVHEDLVKKGIDPRIEPDKYYKHLDNRLRSVFPGKFDDVESDMGDMEPAAYSQASTVVAPAHRSSGRPRKVQLTRTMVDLAKRLGITPKQYAEQLLKEDSRRV
ncbi:hypothetical protein CMI37_28330 [Candidatus Pacearchaeota archaeon]|nr:hypothetical protein [Candidatus Pacearchaeota archaeon]|tara:strand:- start:658 stop:1623 length:966 start_codon:yes stop_codon:yes gene_type:complete